MRGEVPRREDRGPRRHLRGGAEACTGGLPQAALQLKAPELLNWHYWPPSEHLGSTLDWDSMAQDSQILGNLLDSFFLG